MRMTLLRTVEPSVEPVSVAEARGFLRISGTAEDELLAGLIRAARDDVERSTGMALIDQCWRLAVDTLPGNDMLSLPRCPVREILSVTAFGSEGEAELIDPGDLQADLASRPARLLFLKRPVSTRVLNGLEVDFRAGFGEAGTDVPDLLRRAIIVLVAHWYEFRGSFGPADQPVSFPPQYERMIAHYRDRRL